MNNIKWKNILALVAVVLVFGLIVAAKLGYLSSLTGTTDNTTVQSNPNTTSTNGSTTTSPVLQDVNTVDNSSSVGIVAPPVPTNGKTRSITMLGPSGVYNYITKTDGKNYKLLKKAFQPMLVNEGVVSTDDIKKVLNQYINDSWNNGVSSNGDIQIVVASSVATNPKVIAAIPDLKKSYVVTTTSSDSEGAGGFKVAVAPQYYNTAFTMDITPTIVRFAYSQGGTIKTIVAKAGSKYYQNNQTKEQALAEIRNTVALIPASSRQLCIVLWAAAEKDLRSGTNRYNSIPSYSGNERSTISGLELINEVKSATNANMVIDFESAWPLAF